MAQKLPHAMGGAKKKKKEKKVGELGHGVLWMPRALWGSLGSDRTPSSHGSGDFLREPKVYEDLTDLSALKTAMETALHEYNLSPAVVPMKLVLFREAVEHSERLRRPGLPRRPGPLLFQGNGDSFPSLS